MTSAVEIATAERAAIDSCWVRAAFPSDVVAVVVVAAVVVEVS